MENKVIHIFDMDDTLVKTPSLTDVIKIKGGMPNSGDSVIDDSLSKLLDIMGEVPYNENRVFDLAGMYNGVVLKSEDGFIFFVKNGKRIKSDFLDFLKRDDSLNDKQKKYVLDRVSVLGGVLVLTFLTSFLKQNQLWGLS